MDRHHVLGRRTRRDHGDDAPHPRPARRRRRSARSSCRRRWLVAVLDDHLGRATATGSRARSRRVAYRVEGGVAITTGEPFGHRDNLAVPSRAFARYCAENWTPACTADRGGERDAPGRWAGRPQVAEETVLPLGPGVHRQVLAGRRTALNKAGKPGRAECVTSLTHRWRSAADPGHLRGMGGGQGAARDGLHPRRAGRTRRHGGALRRSPSTQTGPSTASPAGCRFTRRCRGRVDTGLHAAAGGCRAGVIEFLIASAALDFQEEGRGVRQPLRRSARPPRPG